MEYLRKGKSLSLKRADATEVTVRYGGIISAVLFVWLLIGVLALYQRGGFDSGISLQTALNVALTVIAGPLNYAGVKPDVAAINAIGTIKEDYLG